MNSKKLLTLITALLASFCIQFTLKAAPVDPHAQRVMHQARTYLLLADKALPPESYQYELLAAELYIKIGALHKAEPLLAALSNTPLPRSLVIFKSKLENAFESRQNEVLLPPVSSKNVEPSLVTTHVGLFLPLSGPHAPAAQAIKAGFLAHHQTHDIQIKLYDTSKTNDIKGLYQKAVQEGAEFIVGPLIKEEVYTLSKLTQADLAIPILALNTHSDIQAGKLKRFFQFALSPEEEAKSLAHKAWRDGHRSTSIIVPDNEWGKRVLSAFSAQWHSLGGKIASTASINPKYNQAAAVRKLLQVSDQYNPKKNLKTKPVNPLRRQDIDMIVLAAPPDQARQLRPLLDFYEANNLKIYATSSVYEGKPQPQQDRDINGVIFCDMPWILNNPQDHASSSLARLYAMGMDAYQLMSRLELLSQSPHAQFQGATGMLSIGANHKIERELTWAQIKNGVPAAL